MNGPVPGDLVRVTNVDPPHHNRAPTYVRGHVGTVVWRGGEYPLPDDVVTRREPPRVAPILAVRFAAAELFGVGDHTVTVDLWAPYVERVPS